MKPNKYLDFPRIPSDSIKRSVRNVYIYRRSVSPKLRNWNKKTSRDYSSRRTRGTVPDRDDDVVVEPFPLISGSDLTVLNRRQGREGRIYPTGTHLRLWKTRNPRGLHLFAITIDKGALSTYKF